MLSLARNTRTPWRERSQKSLSMAPTHSQFGRFPVTDTAILRVTDETTAEELREAITNLNQYAMRLPAHWKDRKATIHARINVLLTELENR